MPPPSTSRPSPPQRTGVLQQASKCNAAPHVAWPRRGNAPLTNNSLHFDTAAALPRPSGDVHSGAPRWSVRLRQPLPPPAAGGAHTAGGQQPEREGGCSCCGRQGRGAGCRGPNSKRADCCGSQAADNRANRKARRARQRRRWTPAEKAQRRRQQRRRHRGPRSPHRRRPPVQARTLPLRHWPPERR